MAYKIIIKRIVPEYKVADLNPLLLELRAHATTQPGYISGETLKRVDNPGEELVISTWQTLEDWRMWLTSKERMEIQKRIDLLLGEKTQYEIYTY
jgi:heme-degrading monooxygenase HmoA